jgi:hypothetical protein
MVKVAADGQLFWDFDSLDLVNECIGADLRWKVLSNLRASCFPRVMKSLDGGSLINYKEAAKKYNFCRDAAHFYMDKSENIYSILTPDERRKYWSIYSEVIRHA